MGFKSLIKIGITKSNALRFKAYDSGGFCDSLNRSGIVSGDDVFVMCSADKMPLETGRRQPINLILSDVLKTIGSEGTLLVLSFSAERDEILNGKIKFNWKKTGTSDGIFTELLRRKKKSFRSIHPIYSAVAYGKNAEFYCSEHHLDVYPFGEKSPFRKIIENNGKYLGIQLDFNQFTLVHCVDDYYKSDFMHRLLEEKIKTFTVDVEKGEMTVDTLIRKRGSELKKEISEPNGKLYFKKLQPITHCQIIDKSGLRIFTMDLKSFFESAIKNYDSRKLTWWNTKV